MDKRSVLRLKSGDTILFGDAKRFEDITLWQTGEVLHVTPQGGVRVRVIEGKLVGGNADWCGPGTGPGAGTEKWVPYHHVWSKR